MEVGISAGTCSCIDACKKGVDPMSDCVVRLPGETVTAYCEVEGGTTWHNNGSCVSCIRKAREDRKKMMADRHEKILAAPANPNEIEDAEILRGSSEVERAPVKRVVEGSIPSPAAISVVLRVSDMDIIIATDKTKIEEILRVAIKR